MKAPLAPMQCQAGRSPFGRTGITDAEQEAVVLTALSTHYGTKQEKH